MTSESSSLADKAVFVPSRAHQLPSSLGGDARTFVDLFAGCGGLSLGLLQAGWRGICAIEKDEFAFATLRANLIDGRQCPQFDWPAHLPVEPLRISKFLKLLASLRVAHDLVGKVDLVAGGPPCQGFSLAGKRRHDDPRNSLFRDYIRVVSLLRPRLLLIENVAAIATKHKGRRLSYADRIQRALRRIGYKTHWEIHRAADFGVPQERPRYFIVGMDSRYFSRASEVWLKEIIAAELETARTRLLQQRGLTNRRGVTVAEAIDDLRAYRRGVRLEPADVPRRLQVRYTPPPIRTAYQKALASDSGAPMDSMRLALHTEAVMSKLKALIQYCKSNNRRGVSLHSDERAVLNSKKTTVVVLHPNRPSHTLTSLPDDLIHYAEPRILTVRECARLQSFPDWFVFRGKYTTGGDLRIQECPRYTQVGNAVAPFVAEALGFALTKVLEQASILHRHGELGA